MIWAHAKVAWCDVKLAISPLDQVHDNIAKYLVDSSMTTSFLEDVITSNYAYNCMYRAELWRKFQ